MSHNAEMILDQIDVVKLDINLWTSSKKLRPEDLVLADGSKLPPEDLANLGTKKTIDPDRLKEFNRIKKEAERICLQSGTRFLGGFANPRDEIPRITQELDDLSKTFYAARDQLLATYNEDTEEWIARHAEFGDAIRRAIEPVESVAAKLRFDYVVFRVTVPQSDVALLDSTPAAVDSLTRRTGSMSEQLFHEIAQEASQLIDRSFVGKDTVTGRSLSAFRRMRDKLDSLGFLDHRCMPVVDKIDVVLDALPKQGPYNGVAFNSLFTLGLLLSDPDKIKRHGSGLLQMDSISSSDAMAPIESDVNDADVSMLDSSAVPVIDLGETVQAPVADTSPVNTDDDNDLPGFDDFLTKYNSSQDVFDTASSVDTGLSLDNVAQDVFEPAPEVNSFMDSVKETVQVAAEIASTSIPVQSKVETDSPATAEVVEDFWF
jgi:hypothetical protein